MGTRYPTRILFLLPVPYPDLFGKFQGSIFVTWHLRVTLDSICNSCDVLIDQLSERDTINRQLCSMCIYSILVCVNISVHCTLSKHATQPHIWPVVNDHNLSWESSTGYIISLFPLVAEIRPIQLPVQFESWSASKWVQCSLFIEQTYHIYIWPLWSDRLLQARHPFMRWLRQTIRPVELPVNRRLTPQATNRNAAKDAVCTPPPSQTIHTGLIKPDLLCFKLWFPVHAAL